MTNHEPADVLGVLHPGAVFIIIVNWNGKEVLQRCLTTLFAYTSYPDYHVVVVDNASKDGSVEMVKEEFPAAKLIENEENLGFSKANNQGIRHAMRNGAKYVLLLNNDIEIAGREWLTEMLNLLESDGKIGIVGCKLVYPSGLIQHAGGVITVDSVYNRGDGEKDEGQYDTVRPVDFITGAVLLIKTEVIKKIGLLDEAFSPIYYEDADWCMRARFYGYKVMYSPVPVLVHKCGSDSKNLGKEKLFSARRNWIRFFLLNFKFTDLAKRILKSELRQIVRCVASFRSNGKVTLKLNHDCSERLKLIEKAWAPSIRDFRNILAKRSQRFMAEK